MRSVQRRIVSLRRYSFNIGDKAMKLLNSVKSDAEVQNEMDDAIAFPCETELDTASYANMRRYINNGKLPPSDAIRTEELVNYFTYDYLQPDDANPVRISAEVGRCPWNSTSLLAKIALKAKEIEKEKLPKSNFVFLIDVSGSMSGDTRLPFVKTSLNMLLNNLRPDDRIAVVTFATDSKVELPSTSGAEKEKIRDVINSLEASGDTSGGKGIQTAYKIAIENYIEDGNNRVILCTDGDFNIGASSTEALEWLIAQNRDFGVYFTALGYGMGNYKDNRIQTLAEKGRGNHAYIDTLQEANKVLVSEFGGTLYAVAKDVKLQIEFNPVQVQSYRLIGYESRRLEAQDFNNDRKDAGAMGAGHCVTAFYEIVPVGVQSPYSINPLRYSQRDSLSPREAISMPEREAISIPERKANADHSNELFNIRLRYKQPDSDKSVKLELPVSKPEKIETASSDFRFAAAVAMFGQILTRSEFCVNSSLDEVIALAKTALDPDISGYRREFVRLVEIAKEL